MTAPETSAEFLARIGGRKMTPEEARQLYILRLNEDIQGPLHHVGEDAPEASKPSIASRFTARDETK